MKVAYTITITVEVVAAGHELEAAGADAVYQTEKALDYWFGHTDRAMTAVSVTLGGKR